MKKILEEIGLSGIVPVIVIEDPVDATPLAKALIDGGLPVAEVTFRTKSARESIEQIAKSFPDMHLGAGTVLTIDQVKSAIDAGAKYIVSPGLNPKVVEYCVVNNIPITPGVATPSDIERALEFNLDVVKYFPAEPLGGLNYLKAISAPYGNLKFIPTGGVDESNLLSYLKFQKVLACGGSWMVKSELISGKKFDEIKQLTEKAVGLMLGFSIKHVGVNCKSPEEANLLTNQLSSMFNFLVQETSGSNFVGGQFEFLKQPLLGEHGHIAIGTNFIERAMYHLEKKGYKFKQETKNVKDGKLATIYLESEFGGFAFHLLQMNP
jgi:2-dehydro-3-deoxyphosphogluconate aldolase/(4S)-4-hydroxy-2-oxoglutarate aldolase